MSQPDAVGGEATGQARLAPARTRRAETKWRTPPAGPGLRAAARAWREACQPRRAGLRRRTAGGAPRWASL